MNWAYTPDRSTTPACSHSLEVCILCLATSIHVQLRSRLWYDVDCTCCGPTSQNLTLSGMFTSTGPTVLLAALYSSARKCNIATAFAGYTRHVVL